MATAERLVIVGAGHCGGRAAERLRKEGFRGRVILIGAESALPYERPPLSKAVLTGDREPADGRLHDEAFYRDHDIELVLGVAATDLGLADRRIALDDGRALAYDRLLLTTGGVCRRLDLPGGDLEGVCYLREVADSLRIRAGLASGARVAVIGGGFIGLEVAASARRVGAEVTLVEVAPRLLGRGVPAAIAELVAEEHRARGVDLRLGATVEAIEGESGRASAVRLADGTRIAAGLVVIGVGIRPATDLAERAGLAVDDGVVVNEFCEASETGVYAAGDAASAFNPRYGRHVRLESWQNAERQAAAAARVIAGERAPYAEVPWVWSDQYDLNLQVAGLADGTDRVVLRGDFRESGAMLAFCFRAGQLVAVAGLGRGTAIGRDLRVGQMLIERGIAVDPELVADPSVKLRALLRAA